MNLVPRKPRRTFGFHFARTAAAFKLTEGKAVSLQSGSQWMELLQRPAQQQAPCGYSINIHSRCQFLSWSLCLENAKQQCKNAFILDGQKSILDKRAFWQSWKGTKYHEILKMWPSQQPILHSTIKGNKHSYQYSNHHALYSESIKPTIIRIQWKDSRILKPWVPESEISREQRREWEWEIYLGGA